MACDAQLSRIKGRAWPVRNRQSLALSPRVVLDLSRLAEVSEVPEHSNLTSEEWDARRTHFRRAAELFLNERWKEPSAAKTH
jgi:hypothetical protein